MIVSEPLAGNIWQEPAGMATGMIQVPELRGDFRNAIKRTDTTRTQVGQPLLARAGQWGRKRFPLMNTGIIEQTSFFEHQRAAMSHPDKPLLNGSNPCRTATNPSESEGYGAPDTVRTQKTSVTEAPLPFPRTIAYKSAEVKVYGRTDACRHYRVCGYVAGNRQSTKHRTFADAEQAARKLAKDIYKGNHSAALNASQAADALASVERLQAFFKATGRRVSILGAVSAFCDVSVKLDGFTVSEAVDGFLRNVASVKRVDVPKAIAEFIEARKARTEAPKNGKRPRLSLEYHSLTTAWLNEFAGTFPGFAVCDLTKETLALYMGHHKKAAPKTRNARRAVVKMFLRWCVERDYLAQTHRLFETTDLKHEPDDPEEIDFYRPAELAALLTHADTQLRGFLALAGLAGIRFKELCRLTWEDVFRVPGYVEIAAMKAKTRSRRLVQVCPALAAWLEPYRGSKGLIWPLSYDQIHWRFGRLRAELRKRKGKGRAKIPNRRNGLRHAFISFHFAKHSDEGLTAAQAGNSPDMVHRHYKGLTTKEEADQWFAVSPQTPANVVVLAGKEGAA